MLPRIPVRLASAWRAAILVLLSLSLAGPPAPALVRADPPVGSVPEHGADQAGLAHVYGDLPLSFEANQGQTDPSVDFLARGGGYSLFLSSTQAVLRLRPEGTSGSAQPGQAEPAEQAQPATVVSLSLLGADGQATVAGLDPLPGTVNYFVGNDPARWHTGIPTYARVQYAGVYPGIDLVYYGNQGQLENDFVVAPGADPGVIRLGVAGADDVQVDAAGDLVMGTPSGELRLHAPVVYQDGPDGRQSVAGNYQLDASGQVGFDLGAYDSTRPLVIDPVLVYSTFLGGTGGEEARAIAVDTAGNAYVVGTTSVGGTGLADFPITAAALQRTNGGDSDAFVAKLNSTGTSLVYSTFLGGRVGESVGGIAVDDRGAAYVTGFTGSPDFPTTAGVFQPAIPTGATNAFVAKLDPSGSALAYSTFLGGSGLDSGQGIAVDAAGNAFVTGTTQSSNFPTTPGAFQPTLGGGRAAGANAFVTKLNPTATALIYSTYLGGSGLDDGFAIAIDTAGSAYVTGRAQSANFPVTAGAFQTAHGSTSPILTIDGFVSKLNPAGTALVYSTFLGGNSGAVGNGIAVDAAGNAFVTGTTQSSNFPTTPGAFQPTLRGNPASDFGDAFVSKLNPTGTALIYSTLVGGTVEDQGFDIAIDATDNAYITGTTLSPDFPITNDAFQPTFGGRQDAFVTRLNATGTALISSTYLGGSDTDTAFSIAVDALGGAYVTGGTRSANLPITPGAFQPELHGVSDAFVAKVAPSVLDASPPVTTASVSPAPNAAGWNRTDVTVTLTATDNTGGSGVKSITFSATGAQTIAQNTVAASTATVTITAEGSTTLTFFAMDQAGNQEAAKTLMVRIDKTAPEARVQFDPARRDIVVLGTDTLSGVPAGPIPPISVTPTSAGRDDEDGDDHDGHHGDDHHGNADLRTFLIQDAAGNTLRLVLKVRRDQHDLRAQVVSLQINGAAVITPAQNNLRVESELEKAGQLMKLQQEVRIGVGQDRQTAEAQFDARDNQTRIEVKQGGTEQKVTRPGLVLLALATNKGALQITF